MNKYGEVGDSLYYYSGTNILRNQFQIEYEEPPYDLNYLKKIHAVLFSDLYAWAGELRQVDIAKGDTRFCTFRRIEIEANKLFAQLQQQQYFQHQPFE